MVPLAVPSSPGLASIRSPLNPQARDRIFVCLGGLLRSVPMAPKVFADSGRTRTGQGVTLQA